MAKVRKQRHTRRAIRGERLMDVKLPDGLPEADDILDEIAGYMDVLMGRVDPPIKRGVHTLQEVSIAYYARAMELVILIQAAERDGEILKGSGHYRLRTGELRNFCELAKRAADLGSRRLTAEQIRVEQRHDASEADELED